MNTIAMIVAAGRGRRAGGTIPKQYAIYKRTPMLRHTIKALLKSSKIDALLVVINPLDIKLYMDSINDLNDVRLLKHCLGGTERTDSVKNGLRELEKYTPKNVIIHDAARPYISVKLVHKLLNSLKTNKAVLPVLPIVDAIWEKKYETESNWDIRPGPDRSNLLLAQTPQAFNYKTICSAYYQSQSNALDDIAIAYKAGINISTIAGDPKNKKITSEEDLKFFKGKK